MGRTFPDYLVVGRVCFWHVAPVLYFPLVEWLWALCVGLLWGCRCGFLFYHGRLVAPVLWFSYVEWLWVLCVGLLWGCRCGFLFNRGRPVYLAPKRNRSLNRCGRLFSFGSSVRRSPGRNYDLIFRDRGPLWSFVARRLPRVLEFYVFLQGVLAVILQV